MYYSSLSFPFTVRFVFRPIWFLARRQLLLFKIFIKLFCNRYKSANLRAELPPRPLAMIATIRYHGVVVEFVFVKEIRELLDDTLG